MSSSSRKSKSLGKNYYSLFTEPKEAYKFLSSHSSDSNSRINTLKSLAGCVRYSSSKKEEKDEEKGRKSEDDWAIQAYQRKSVRNLKKPDDLKTFAMVDSGDLKNQSSHI